jgi:hypothetical protein
MPALSVFLFSGFLERLLRRGLAPFDLSLRVHRPAALGRSAIADGLVVAAVIEAIIVGDLFAGGDLADGLDPDAPALLAGLTVGVATVVDEHGHAMAVDDHLATPKSKQIGDGRGFIGLVRLGLGEPGAGVFGDARAFADFRCGIAAGGVDGGGADDQGHANVRCFPLERYEPHGNSGQWTVNSGQRTFVGDRFEG